MLTVAERGAYNRLYDHLNKSMNSFGIEKDSEVSVEHCVSLAHYYYNASLEVIGLQMLWRTTCSFFQEVRQASDPYIQETLDRERTSIRTILQQRAFREIARLLRTRTEQLFTWKPVQQRKGDFGNIVVEIFGDGPVLEWNQIFRLVDMLR